MDKIIFFCVVLTFATAISALAHNDFLISFWYGPTEITQKRFAEIAEANFNVAMISDAQKQALDLCQANGLKMIVCDPRVMAKEPADENFGANLDAIVADYSSHPALWGYFVTDEPNSAQFEKLGCIVSYLNKKDPTHPAFINILPNYATPAQLGNPTFEQHVDEYLRVVRPKLLSYDHYALLEKGERGDYFDNLEVIRRQSIKHNVPFSSIILAVPHGSYRDPSEADLRWQVNTSLAYGARGIMYFTLWTPVDSYWNFHDAIIDADGKRNRKYEIVKGINAELKVLGPLMMRLRSAAVYHSGTIPAGAKPIPADNLISGINGGDFVIGQFIRDDAQMYAMIVNRSFTKTAHAKIEFSRKVGIYEVDRRNAHEHVRLPGNVNGSYVWEADFAPGEGKLVRLEVLDGITCPKWEDKLVFRPRVMLNPSVQFGNVIYGENGEELYNEGRNMYDIAIKVRDELLKDGRLDVFMSRASKEEQTSLPYETSLARSLNCDAFVALHSDATGIEGNPGGGTWTFYANDESKRLGECVQMPLLEAIRSFYPEVKFRGVRTHWYRLWVLNNNYCPASLTETLFHSNPTEREMLKNPHYQDIMAKAIAKGILNYFGF